MLPFEPPLHLYCSSVTVVNVAIVHLSVKFRLSKVNTIYKMVLDYCPCEGEEGRNRNLSDGVIVVRW